MASTIDPTQDLLFRTIATSLQAAGLGALFTYVNGKPSGWLWDTIVKGDFTTQEEIQTLLEDRAEFKERFAPIFEQRKAAAAGQPIQVMTPAEQLQWEQAARAISRQYNLPPGFYDNYKDFAPLISKGMSPQQFEQRVKVSYNRVANLDPAIQAAFRDYYGVTDNSHLASFFLDPNKYEQQLETFSRAAAIGGIAGENGYSVSKTEAEKLAQMGFDESQRSNIARVGTSALFKATASESDTLHAGEQGIEAALGVNAQASKDIEQRRLERSAEFAGGGGAARTSGGSGVGEAP